MKSKVHSVGEFENFQRTAVDDLFSLLIWVT